MNEWKLIILVIVLFYGCSNNRTELKKNNEIDKDSVLSKQDTDSVYNRNRTIINLEDSINYTDKSGLKQGKWITRGLKGEVVEIKSYKNDTLHGLYQKLDGTPFDENYVMGKKEGYKYVYYKNRNRLMSVSYFENDSSIWIGFPAANEDFLIPIKHFHSNRDSVFIRAPYENGKTWYEGYFCLNPSKMNNGRIMTYCYGLHKIYFRNGKLKGVVDYIKQTIQEFDSLGNELYYAKFEEQEVHKQPLSNY